MKCQRDDSNWTDKIKWYAGIEKYWASGNFKKRFYILTAWENIKERYDKDKQS